MRRVATAICLAFSALLLAASPAAAFGPLTHWGSLGTGDGQFSDMFGAAVDANGNVWVPDGSGGERVEKFTANGQFLMAIGWGVQNGMPAFQKCTSGCLAGISGAGDGQFNSPKYAATDAAGDVYITDDNDRVQEFSPSGDFIRKWGSSGTAEGQFGTAFGIAVDPAGNVYVVDRSNSRIQKFTSTGAFIDTFGWGVQNGNPAFQVCNSGCQAGITGSGDGQFDGVKDVTTDAAGDVYVADRANDRIQEFSSGSGFLRKWGTTGSTEGQFIGPGGVATDPAGAVYVADANNHRIQKFSPIGAFINTFGWGVQNGTAAFQICSSSCQAGIPGSGDGQFNAMESLAIDCRGNIYVPDFNDYRVQKFGEPGAGDPPCVAPKPSNAFSFGKLHRNKRRGTATLDVIVPGPGTLVLAGSGLVPQRHARAAGANAKTVTAAGTVKLKIKAKGHKRKKLNKRGKVKVKANVTFTPTGGDPASQTRKIKLIKRHHHS